MQAFFAGKTEIFFFFCAGGFPRRSGRFSRRSGPFRAAFPAVRAPPGPFPRRSGGFPRSFKQSVPPRAMKAVPQAPIPPKKMQIIFSLFCNKPRVSASYK